MTSDIFFSNSMQSLTWTKNPCIVFIIRNILIFTFWPLFHCLEIACDVRILRKNARMSILITILYHFTVLSSWAIHQCYKKNFFRCFEFLCKNLNLILVSFFIKENQPWNNAAEYFWFITPFELNTICDTYYKDSLFKNELSNCSGLLYTKFKTHCLDLCHCNLSLTQNCFIMNYQWIK